MPSSLSPGKPKRIYIYTVCMIALGTESKIIDECLPMGTVT